MCFKTPKVPAVQPAPTRNDVQQDVTNQRKRLSTQQGVFGNIFTSALGDSSYGKNANNIATLGGSAGGGVATP